MVVSPRSLSRQGNAKVTRMVCENVPMQGKFSLPVTGVVQGRPPPPTVSTRAGNGGLSMPVRCMCV